ncbi:hypothetical protein LOR37_04950 [Clostridium estertheticum]|nr:hypothetical protein [Clostridium estertheticum]MCB2361613.1 hypothetical protein [Clostridium estertheticum]WBL49182.1 hypothetical protein LOR37_04950 [Clostridium estertheticum]
MWNEQCRLGYGFYDMRWEICISGDYGI